jgi:hypothetical protein
MRPVFKNIFMIIGICGLAAVFTYSLLRGEPPETENQPEKKNSGTVDISKFIPSLSVGDKWSVEVTWRQLSLPDGSAEANRVEVQKTRKVEYEVLEEKEVEDREGLEVTAYVIQCKDESGADPMKFVVRKDLFTLVRWYRIKDDGSPLGLTDENKPSDRTYTSTVESGCWRSSRFIEFPRFPEGGTDKTEELDLRQGPFDDYPPYKKVTQETKFSDDVMEITITAELKTGETKKVYIKWEKGKKWWSKAEKWELDAEGEEIERTRYTATLVEE